MSVNNSLVCKNSNIIKFLSSNSSCKICLWLSKLSIINKDKCFIVKSSS